MARRSAADVSESHGGADRPPIRAGERASAVRAGLLEEDKFANQTKGTVEAQGSIHVFFAERESRKVEGLPPGEARRIASAGVVGAGTMGGGIAIAFANAGIPVTLLDARRRAGERPRHRGRHVRRMVKRGRIDAAERRAAGAHHGTVELPRSGAQADVIIEAVFESMDLKKEDHASRRARARRPAR